MQRDERKQLRELAADVQDWAEAAAGVRRSRAEVVGAAATAGESLRSRFQHVTMHDSPAWYALPLIASDTRLLADLARERRLPVISSADGAVLDQFGDGVTAALDDIRSEFGAGRLFRGHKKRDASGTAAQFIEEFHGWATGVQITDVLARIKAFESAPDSIPLDDLLAEHIGFQHRVAAVGADPNLVTGRVLADLPTSLATIRHAVDNETRFRVSASRAGDALRQAETRRLVADMPVERLKDATRDRIRVSPLTDAGITSIRDVLDREHEIEYLQGIGATTATRIRGAARTLWQTAYDEMPVRIDIRNRTSEATELLRCLGAWDAMRTTKGATADLARAEALGPLSVALRPGVSHLLIISASSPTSEFGTAVDSVLRRAELIREATGQLQRPTDPWDDFLARPADYFSWLAELGFLIEDDEKSHGDLPEDIVEAVRALDLDTEHLTASLRGYQSFGARFALVQRKVVIGDEMGLGKTVEALAVLAHLRAKGEHHSLVICPAAVVTNWVREVAAKSQLVPHRLHGPGRATAAQSWARRGGVAVTTFESLGWFEERLSAVPELGCVVVDEAHYVKNPVAARTRRTTAIIDRAERALLLTGTPLENRLEEFRNLVGYLRPDLTVDAGELSPRRFRQQVAPAYLRRNTVDVLTELPELIEIDEWLPLSTQDDAAYRDAVAAGNFMAMRQAAMLHDTYSEKISRLIEIVQEAGANGRRTIVFSYFRDVLDHIARALPGTVFGPLTGSVPAAARQVMVDQFTAAAPGAALVSQIVAGGVGLNIQSASVVVICEPQLKPTTEWQAIARARRMGQLRSVQVHRLLSENCVDQRIIEILARKKLLFEEFARISETAQSAPEAYDVTEAELARDVVASERQRLFAATPGS